ncbi:CDP-alcohol phosphatidyltransferase family protein [Vibrio algivorus]|uniref:CDP-alcohol phosphatidyltransferase family protein n=1 Tax=Vibrio algivorus TaxID=1667024 RepID=A0A557PFT9_9VIBR|nr:CDP-alcohol phosphatidyltransferase family protein [Vibrio algivorus]TVO39504.1 CDP-alcohol phosphatidyltransferase family protein [Vibrio algivorus]GLT14379.1 membrane protein [Vibrio algivorus]
MLDRYVIPLIKHPLNSLAKQCVQRHIKADHVTLASFLIGLLAIPALWGEHYLLALLLIVLNRIGDGLDGAIARQTQTSDAGGFLDICLDFIFYALIPFGFILANPEQNTLWAALLIVSFVGTGSSFLAFASIAGKRNITNPVYQHKSLYYMSGITEGTETIGFFIAFCLWPALFPQLAAIFAALCFITTINRIWAGYRTIQSSETQ